jgi:hypothetical protein
MIIIKHRINTLTELEKIDFKFGVEVDIRSYNNELVLNHEPMSPGDTFKEWIKKFKHAFLIINIKEEGLEPYIQEIIEKEKINNYFLLDQSFPYLVKFSKIFHQNTAIRLSEFESIDTSILSSTLSNWIWVDCFSKFTLDQQQIEHLSKVGYKICIVSPELQGRVNYKEEVHRLLEDVSIDNIDAVCTKDEFFWMELQPS